MPHSMSGILKCTWCKCSVCIFEQVAPCHKAYGVVDDQQPADSEQAESEAAPEPQQPNSKDTKQEGKKGSKGQDKGPNGKQEGKAKAKANAKASEKSKKPGKGKGKGKNRDIEDLKSKLPPDMKTFDFSDLKDLDMESLKAKLEGMNAEKKGQQTALAFIWSGCIYAFAVSMKLFVPEVHTLLCGLHS